MEVMERITGTMVPSASPPAGAQPRTWARGRRCAADGCSTVLSMYNPSHLCAVHAARAETAEVHAPVDHVARLVACEYCGVEVEARKASRKYCSDRCRMAAYQARQRGGDAGQRTSARVGAGIA